MTNFPVEDYEEVATLDKADAKSKPCPLINRRQRSPKRDSSSSASSSLSTITLSSGWQIQFSPTLVKDRAAWDALDPPEDFFLSGDFFSLLNRIDLGDVTMGFAIFEHADHGRFGLILQTFSFNPEEQMGKLDQNAHHGRWRRLAGKTKDVLAKILRFRILTVGQLLLTGDHALRGECALDQAELSALVAEGSEAIARAWPERIHGIMLKDMSLEEHPRAQGFHPLPVQPNMVLHLAADWHSFDDYLDAMSSKYRVRARRARKKGTELERREMSLAEVKDRQAEMHRMYRKIAEQSDFNAVVLPADYFTAWLEQLPERFKIWGYFVEEKFIGFSTAVYNGHELEAHYLGFDADYNRSHQLYLNILYDLVQEAILAGNTELVFSRTALEIKSSVGAEPETLHCWMRARYAIANPLVPIVAKFIAPLPEWEARHPFK